jgi:hypothetical protein
MMGLPQDEGKHAVSRNPYRALQHAILRNQTAKSAISFVATLSTIKRKADHPLETVNKKKAG